MKIAEIVNFKSSSDASSIPMPPLADPQDVRLLVLQFLECNGQFMLGILPVRAAERFYNQTVRAHLDGLGLQDEADYQSYVQSFIALVTECRQDHSLIPGLSPRNAHILDRLIERLQMELLPTEAITARQLRSVSSHTGIPYKLEEFIAMTEGAAYVRWHWGDMIALAEAKGGHALGTARRLQEALDGLDTDANAAEIDVMALAMGQFH